MFWILLAASFLESEYLIEFEREEQRQPFAWEKQLWGEAVKSGFFSYEM